MKIETEVKTIQVDYKCPVCKEGYLRPTGTVLASNPPIYPHLCNRAPGCAYGENLNVSYPRIEYRPLTSMEKFKQIF